MNTTKCGGIILWRRISREGSVDPAGSGLKHGAQVDFFLPNSELDANMVAVGQDGTFGKMQQHGYFLVRLAVADHLRHL